MHEYDNPKIKYIDVYQYRVDRYGANHKEREYNYNVKKFEKYLQSHPSSQNVFIDNTETLASIISNKQDQYKLTKQILTSINSNIHPGSIIDWDNDKWIVYQKEHQPNQTYDSCYMIQCNKEIKWIDDYGIEQSAWAYIFSSKDSIVKQNFRTWNRLITPQPNQWLEMIIPTNESLKINQKFIIDNRAWFIDEYDATSSKGITYYSLTEDKIDRFDDDIDNKIADINKLNKCYIYCPNEIICGINDRFIFPLVVYNEGKITKEPLNYIIHDDYIASIQQEDDYVIISPNQKGNTVLEISLVNQPKIVKFIDIRITDISEQATMIVGDESIKTTDYTIYTIYKIGNNKTIDPIINFEISDRSLARGLIMDDGSVKIIANEDNKLGKTKIIFYTNSSQYEKEITIKSLW